MKKKAYIITDLQFGSTGKGLFAGYLARRHEVDTIVTAWGPNAGHTYKQDPSTPPMVHIALPNGIVSPKLKRILLGPGSIINPEILIAEMQRSSYWLEGVDLVIHENAAVVQERHREEEAGTGLGIGSTMKGVGAAVQEKIRRNVDDRITAGRVLYNTPLEGHVVDAWLYQKMLDEAEKILIEGAQGYSLSINHGFYPYTTSRDCTTLQIMSDCGIPCPSQFFEFDELLVYGVARTFPIRVANRFRDEQCPCVKFLTPNLELAGPESCIDRAVDMMVNPPMSIDNNCPSCKGTGRVNVRVGWSGPCYPDQEEIEWSALGREPELTTVTRLPRRIFTFSMQQIEQAVRQNGVDAIFLNFCNYLDEVRVHELVSQIERRLRIPVAWQGWGPCESDIREMEQ